MMGTYRSIRHANGTIGKRARRSLRSATLHQLNDQLLALIVGEMSKLTLERLLHRLKRGGCHCSTVCAIHDQQSTCTQSSVAG